MLSGSPGRKKKPELIPIKPPNGAPVNPNYLKQQTAKSKTAAAVAVKVKPQEESSVEKDGQKIPVTRDLTKLQQISIKAGRSKIIESQDDSANGENGIKGPVTEFSNEQLMEVWNRLASDLRSQGKDSLYITLTKRPPVVGENYIITLSIDNKTQEQSLEREKQIILEFLRTELNNFAIMLETIIENTGDDTFLYTNKEKFKKLAEKNPHLLLLQKRLNLDIDF